MHPYTFMIPIQIDFDKVLPIVVNTDIKVFLQWIYEVIKIVLFYVFYAKIVYN